MKTKTKKLINVQPKSKKAINRFKNIMDSLHAMEVEQDNDTQMFVVSINRRYCFWMEKHNDPHWEII
jgi:DNA-binding SARP family transcriptional activator